ncbi:hypothetical protein NPIL_333461 [Nephila pilipes]|uniref:Uncharacterized protein n=1 Tax=Nephila pilipes TaxID=299642 RepID=A0A8X6MKQ2_NEPPI|nr:hypothetical protein NPIL_333461 [Nephila pilipes]
MDLADWTLSGFSTICKSDGIRAIYQYLTFSKEFNINGLELSITATADQLEPQTFINSCSRSATFGDFLTWWPSMSQSCSIGESLVTLLAKEKHQQYGGSPELC